MKQPLSAEPSWPFSSGDSFWIVVGQPNEFWPSYLDWCLNFQYSRWRTRPEADLAPELKEILLEDEIAPTTTPKTNPNQCLIAAKHFLPCDYVNFFSCPVTDIENWLPQAAQIWRGLKKPSFRVFSGEIGAKNQGLWKTASQLFEGQKLNIISEQVLHPTRAAKSES